MPIAAATIDPTKGPKVNVALIQIQAGKEGGKQDQIKRMRELVLQAVKEGNDKNEPVHLIVLPEMWNGSTLHDELIANAEPVPEPGQAPSEWSSKSETVRALADAAIESKVWIIGGSIPEQGAERLYNTATVYSPEGALIAKYRKTHLFDLCLPKMTYKESDTFAPGDHLTTFDTPFGRFGLAICYDLRFAEIAILASRKGCTAVFYPAAFNTHTGPLHWELLQRGRALDNQIYVATCSCARDETAKYVIYGHSMAVSPMGKVIATAETEEKIVYATFDPQHIADTRAGIPLLTQRRFDLYPDILAVAEGNAQ
ncbi:Hydrolase [Vanrija pseudolonga]|uniref:Hydrolase n=1 Tax=Vanrija pseudolonga TaxID=143232 RepID=A0AAF0Y1L9_9TREE|nr:Hydrolase [Vanrija pseudolonga]